MNNIKILEREFEVIIPEADIHKAIDQMVHKMRKELEGKEVVIIGVLDGSFMFLADLVRRLDLNVQMTFLKLSSYAGTQSTGKVLEQISLYADIKDKTVVVVEDILDTGGTLRTILDMLKDEGARETKVATLFYKIDSILEQFKVDYVGMQVPDRFVVGYGLDYDGYGRQLRDLYALV